MPSIAEADDRGASGRLACPGLLLPGACVSDDMAAGDLPVGEVVSDQQSHGIV